MDPDKWMKWLEIAKSFNSGDFWSDLADQPNLHDVLNKHPVLTDQPRQPSASFPKADVLTKENEIIVLVDLPGVYKEEVTLSVADEHIYIRGKVKYAVPDGTPFTTERFQGDFERYIRLPHRINTKAPNIIASFNNGLLIVRIPKIAVHHENIRID